MESDEPKSISGVSDVRLTFAAICTELYKVKLSQVPLLVGSIEKKTSLNTAHNVK